MARLELLWHKHEADWQVGLSVVVDVFVVVTHGIVDIS